MEEILHQIDAIPGTSYLLHSFWGYGSRKFYCTIKREHNDDKIEIQRNSNESPLLALQEAWGAFENLVRFGVPHSELQPVLEHKPVELIDDSNPF